MSDDHEWNDGILRCRIVPSGAPERHKIQEWIVPGNVNIPGYWEDMEDPEYYGAAEEILRLAAKVARMSAIFREGVPYTDKLTGRSERVCPGCAAVLDDRGWLCASDCPVVAMREES